VKPNRILSAQLLIFALASLGAGWAGAQSWTVTMAPLQSWVAVASSQTGTKLLAAPADGPIYTSPDAGVTWVQSGAPMINWTSVVSSADGSKLAAAIGIWRPWLQQGGPIFTSTNAGATWVLANTPDELWSAVACSADGSHMVAVAKSGEMYSSADAGATWRGVSAPSEAWSAVAFSADGSRLVATVEGNVIYTARTSPTPELGFFRSDRNLGLSWTIPSMHFVLQQSFSLDAPSWSDVPTTPAVNLTSLQSQVTLPASGGRAFYRLVSR
jgi:hypothetical protein